LSREALSRREQEVLSELRNGGRVSTIARRLSISPTTVRNHLQRIFFKLGVHSQAELIEYVRDHPEALGITSSGAAGVSEAEEARYRDANTRLGQEINSLIEAHWGPDCLPEVMYRALPLDPTSRDEWLARLTVWSREGGDDLQLSTQRSSEMDIWRKEAEIRLIKGQNEGWLRSDLEAATILEQLFSLLVGVALQLVVELGSERREAQLRIVDAYVEDLLTLPEAGGAAS